IDRLEAQLSLFRSSSEIAHLNARAAREPVRVTPSLFALLQHAQQLNAESDGAFDITVAPLLRCWGFLGGSGHLPAPEDLAAARAKVGMHLVQLEPKDFTVRFLRPGVMLDLGAIGKGYAVERATELLRELGVCSALLHGGTSTVYGLGQPPEAEFWKVAISPPQGSSGSRTNPDPIATVALKDEALSVSAVWGKFFEAEGQTFGHILDPRTGQAANRALLSAVVLPSATETDALSTALLTLGPEGHARIASLRPAIRTLVVAKAAGQWTVRSQGIEGLRL
ncbi:MAG TPA: FAD:protein FMN transferase, partial [Candidatus Sulfotelmatobacter sp.]|nr:FAD:protein FMN transferase [Candidatus Sulfotelmatobacter sp.]